MKLKKVLKMGIFVVSLLTFAGCSEGEYIFPDPVVRNFADPFVLTANNGKFYMYGTSTTENGIFRAWSSTDLETWVHEGIVFYAQPDGWAYTNFWAPEVVEHNGRFYMFYTARERETDRLHIGLAVADSPTGPFLDRKNEPLLGLNHANIDGSPFFAEDGRIFLYFSRDCSENIVNGVHRSDIYVVELDDNFNPIGEPLFLFSPEQEWETLNIWHNWRWNEGPSVIKVDGIYFMTYSGNPYFSFEYAIGVATSDSPLGPFIKYENNPVLQGSKQQNVSGPGHNSIFKSHDGSRTFIAYHTHIDPEAGGGHREVRISEVEFANGTMRLIQN